MEYIGKYCFYFSGIEEITLPSTLKEISKGAFDCCGLRTVLVEEGCTFDVRKYMGDNVEACQK